MTDPPAVLVVDDDEDIRFIAMTTLARADTEGRFRHLEAASGEEALRIVADLADRHTPTLVLCDYRMPGMEGPDVCRGLEPYRKRIPLAFVLVTSLDARWSQEAARGAGIDRVLEKEYGVAAWRTQMQTLLSDWSGGRLGTPPLPAER